jgi:hypothetical protein
MELFFLPVKLSIPAEVEGSVGSVGASGWGLDLFAGGSLEGVVNSWSSAIAERLYA